MVFFIFLTSTFFAQKLDLYITSLNVNDNLVLEKIAYQKKHIDSISIYIELNRISIHLKNIGYFTHSLDSITKTTKEYNAYFNLEDRIEEVVLKSNSDIIFLLKKHTIVEDLIYVPIEKLEILLLEISSLLDKDGRSFSKVKLKNILITGKILFADLEIKPSEKRVLNKILVKGYDNFPASFIKNYFNIKSDAEINQKKITEISNLSKGIKFIQQIKTPEILFTKDSTLLYLYLKKHPNNSFDGLVNFASDETGKLLFNGTIDLKFNNILDSGEKFEMFWNSIGYERQEFKILTEIPYVFNTLITPELSFSIYKQDSSFLNTTFNSKIKYQINDKLKVGVSYNSETSNILQTLSSTDEIDTFNSNFIGFYLSYTIPKNDKFFNNKFHLEIKPEFGKRKIAIASSNQFKIKAITSYIWDINYRNSIYVKNDTGVLNSDSYLNNELFRIGGANSIRGFNEQSVFTRNYTFFNIEYRFLTSETSYLYSITDLGKVKEEKRNLVSFGLGFKFINNKTIIDLGIVVNKEDNSQILTKNAKIIINWKVLF